METLFERLAGIVQLVGVLALIGFVFYLGYATLMSIDVNVIEQAIRNLQSSQTNY